MELEFEITKTDYKTFYKQHFINALQKRIFAVVAFPLLIGFAFAGQPFEWTKFIAGTFISGILFLIIFYLTPYLVSINKFSKLISSEPGYLEKKKLSITESGLYFETATRKGTWNWESIVSFKANEQFVSLLLADKKFYLIPRRAFTSDNELTNFLGIVQSKIIKTRGTTNPIVETTNKKPPYLLGLICLIPLIGAFVGLVFIILGATRFKDKWFTLIGVGGIVFTIIIYSSLFYASNHSSIFTRGFKEMSQMQLNSLVKNIEYYKLQNGQYPDSLQQLTKDDKSVFIYDAIQSNQQRKDNLYNYLKVGEKYKLFSSGEDGIPNTKDDLYPQLTAKESSKIGLIKYECKLDTTQQNNGRKY